MQNKKSGFTLIQTLVVIIIIAMLSLGGLLMYLKAQKSTRDARRRTDVAKIMEALEHNYLYTDSYPSVGDTTCASILVLGTYFPSGIPKDAQGNQYSCKNRDKAGAVDLTKYCVLATLEVAGTGNCNANCVSATGGTSACAYSN